MTQQIGIRATYMRGGTSKGVFFLLSDLPTAAQTPGAYRDQLLLRIIGSPDPYGKHTDGMGGATSSTSKTVILSKSERQDCDVNYLFGQVSIDKPVIDWSGNCGNLTAAVGVFAVNNGLVDAKRVSDDSTVIVRVWQQNIEKVILVKVRVENGQAIEIGDFELDGVTFPAAEIEVTFTSPADGDSAVLPTGNSTDTITVEGLGEITASLINAGIPTVFVNASDIGLSGSENQEHINGNSQHLAMLEAIRVAGAKAMGINLGDHVPKVAFVAPAASYIASSGKAVEAAAIDLLVRAVSMGKLHHAMMGTAAVAIASAASIPDTVVYAAAGQNSEGKITFGHPSGTLAVGAHAENVENTWIINAVTMSRSARTLMKGEVFVPH